MKNRQIRLHIYLDDDRDERTTAGMDIYLFNLLTLHLGFQPDSDDAHKAIRDWAQQIVEDTGYHRYAISQLLREKAIMLIVDKKLSKKYTEWRLSREKTKKKPRKTKKKG